VLPAAQDAAASSFGITQAAANPAIVKKVKKVVDTRLDAPELAVALQQLSEFYGECSGDSDVLRGGTFWRLALGHSLPLGIYLGCNVASGLSPSFVARAPRNPRHT